MRKTIEQFEKMTWKNQMQFALSKMRRFVKNPSEETFPFIREMWVSLYSMNCGNCEKLDFGYCGLMEDSISDYDRMVKYCIPSMIKSLENELKK